MSKCEIFNQTCFISVAHVYMVKTELKEKSSSTFEKPQSPGPLVENHPMTFWGSPVRPRICSHSWDRLLLWHPTPAPSDLPPKTQAALVFKLPGLMCSRLEGYSSSSICRRHFEKITPTLSKVVLSWSNPLICT